MMWECINRFFTIPLVSVLVGAIIAWFFAWLYYKKAGDELKSEASRLHHMTEMILRWLEAKGENVSVIRSADGKPTGLAVKADVSESCSAIDISDAVVIRGQNDNDS